MAGFQNKVVYSEGSKITPTSSGSRTDLQQTATEVSSFNYTGNPEGVISANPASLCHDPVSGTVYKKNTGVGNTGWAVLGLPEDPLSTAHGGTGLASPGTSGNVLTSNGTIWISASSALPGQLNVATVTLTSLQIKALHATPIPLIAAPGAGKIILLASPVWAKFNYGGTNVFTAAAGQTIGPYYGTGTLVTTAIIISNTIIVSSSSLIVNQPVVTLSSAGVNPTLLENLAINLYNPIVTEIAGNAGNNNTVTFTALYYIATL